MSFWSIDGPFARAVNKFVDMVYVGLLWFLCSIPIFTIGASTTALYEVLLKMAKNHEGNIGSTFFRCFKSNFRSSTPVWLIILFLIAVVCINFLYYAVLGNGELPVQSAVFGILLLIMLTVSGFAFPVMARFENNTSGTFRITIQLILRNLWWAVVIALLQALTVFICYFFLYFPLMFIMGIFGYIQAVIFNHIFDKLIEEGKITETNKKQGENYGD